MSNNDLRSAVRGRVWLSGEEGFDQAAAAWNLTVEQPVAAVVEAADADDVAALVRHAGRAGLTVTAQPRGHGATGDVDGLILLRTTRLDEVTIHADQGWARVGAGVTWGQVQTEAGARNLTGLAGSTPQVSVVGYLLGGGLSWFSRKYGWAADSVVAFDIVDADGRQARVSVDSDPDLFWALRGGGGDFAIVTAVEFRLFPERSLYGGRITWQGDKAAQVFDAYREVTTHAPRELSVWVHRLQFPKAPPLVAVDVTYLGDQLKAEELLAPLSKIDGVMADRRTMLSTADLGHVTDEPITPAPALPRNELLVGLDEATVEILLAEPIAPLIDVHLRHLGGRLAEPGPLAGASGALGEPYLLGTLGLGINPQLTEAVQAKQSKLVAQLGDRVSGRKPYTFLAAGESASQAFPEETLARLREIKRARDPHHVFHANYPVRH
ncbi:FAD-binding oxidoreductase [Nonomuraea diastatica]|uniref:FAD-binding oxidoreductase n=1 Tax=Nonomuraea diastatica TaxID=1848329 RepID=A0A4R4VQF9_9ACTN|nr:FAD-binding oxidoreductase [Nonomuraea diastatica]TDD08022.1 FAD-binding oxidoreductase [Nonomuraea diastatica]